MLQDRLHLRTGDEVLDQSEELALHELLVARVVKPFPPGREVGDLGAGRYGVQVAVTRKTRDLHLVGSQTPFTDLQVQLELGHADPQVRVRPEVPGAVVVTGELGALGTDDSVLDEDAHHPGSHQPVQERRDVRGGMAVEAPVCYEEVDVVPEAATPYRTVHLAPVRAVRIGHPEHVVGLLASAQEPIHGPAVVREDATIVPTDEDRGTLPQAAVERRDDGERNVAEPAQFQRLDSLEDSRETAPGGRGPSNPIPSGGTARLWANVRDMHLPVMPPVQPMLAKSVKGVPDPASFEGGLLFEPKWDGF